MLQNQFVSFKTHCALSNARVLSSWFGAGHLTLLHPFLLHGKNQGQVYKACRSVHSNEEFRSDYLSEN
jgi:hypothetical protein